MSRQLIIGLVVLLVIVVAVGAYMWRRHHGSGSSGAPLTLRINRYQVNADGSLAIGVTPAPAVSDPGSLIGRTLLLSITALGDNVSGTIVQAGKGVLPGAVQVLTAPGVVSPSMAGVAQPPGPGATGTIM